jgi:hypothetical protein
MAGIIKIFEKFNGEIGKNSDYTKSLTHDNIHELFVKVFEFYEYAQDIMTQYQLEWINSCVRSLVLHTHKKTNVMDIEVDKLSGAAFYETEICSENNFRLAEMGQTFKQLKRFTELGKHSRKDDLELLIESEIIDEIGIPMDLASIRNIYLQHDTDNKYYPSYEVNFRFNNSVHKGIEIQTFLETKKEYFDSMGFELADISAGYDGYKLTSSTKVGKFEIYVIDTEDIMG